MVAEVVADKPVALEDSEAQELSQGILFPVDEDEAKLVDVGDMYDSLSEQQRQLVRGYMKGVRRHGADFQMKHWAEYAGLPKSTFYDRLKTDDMVKVAAATREAMVLTGKHDCARAALVMGKAVLSIERLIDEGKAKVEDLAKAMGILQHAIALSSGMLPCATSTRSRAQVSLHDADGRRISMEVETGATDEGDDVARALSRLQGHRRETLRAAAQAADPESVRADEGGEPAIDVPATAVAEAAG